MADTRGRFAVNSRKVVINLAAFALFALRSSATVYIVAQNKRDPSRLCLVVHSRLCAKFSWKDPVLDAISEPVVPTYRSVTEQPAVTPASVSKLCSYGAQQVCHDVNTGNHNTAHTSHAPHPRMHRRPCLTVARQEVCAPQRIFFASNPSRYRLEA